MDKDDAELFTELCTFGWMIGEFAPIIYDVDTKIYQKHKITFAALKHLDGIGLIQFETVAGYARKAMPKRFTAYYYGVPTVLEFAKESENVMSTGHVLLTSIGVELAAICSSCSDAEFREYTIQKWKGMGYIKKEGTE
jgi:hypothetical protein